jgi:FlaA1/EpsC-like NDP-sugar epimerase
MVKSGLAMTLDATLAAFSTWFALSLRFERPFGLSPGDGEILAIGWSVAIPLVLLCGSLNGLYKTVFRHLNIHALTGIVFALIPYTIVHAFIFSIVRIGGYPLSTGVWQPLLLTALMLSSRILIRLALSGWRLESPASSTKGLVIFGAGDLGRRVLSLANSSRGLSVQGFVDDDVSLQGRLINGVPVISPQELRSMAATGDVEVVWIAIGQLGAERRREIIESLRSLKLRIQTITAYGDRLDDTPRLEWVQDLAIDDLLGRIPFEANESIIGEGLLNKTVLVTGAGGSIGSELCRQILEYSPAKIVLYEHSESALYQIDRELRTRIIVSSPKSTRIMSLLGSVLDRARLQDVMSTYRPDVVYHAAAYKHVPIVEENSAQGVLNNVLGTRLCAEVAEEAGVGRFVLVSTDKAVRPTSVMGASKRVAEMILQAMAVKASKTIFSIVRFGNVLGSSGSVVPLFKEQIARGGPVTVTHRDMTRYFMSVPEAARLVLEAGFRARGGEVFFLDMGQPVRIMDLAERMIELSGASVKNERNPSGDIAIEVTGLRPGEKLFEELLINEQFEKTENSGIYRVKEPLMPKDELAKYLSSIETAASNGRSAEARDRVFSLIRIPERTIGKTATLSAVPSTARATPRGVESLI